MAQNKIAVYSLADLKNTTDDALPNYLTSLKFSQNNYYTDVRLAIGYASVTIAGALFYFDWTLGWDATKAYTLPAVVAYFLLNSAFTYWTWAIERGMVFTGERQGTRVVVSSKTEKHQPVYHLIVKWQDQGGKWEQKQTQAEFRRWFTAEGFFVAKPFQQWLASEVPIIGDADPENVVEDIGRGSVSERSAASGIDVNSLSAGQLDQVLSSMAGTQPKKNSKSRRKA